jgi:sugar phosphate isomerase/epimerase
MRIRGIHYDTGIATVDGTTTRPTLPLEVVEREVADIRDGLHANAIRISSDRVERLAEAAAVAARTGLDVWLSPMLPNADPRTTTEAIAACARSAEGIRRDGGNATLVVGCELSVFMSGILPGATHADRLTLLTDPLRLMTEVANAGLDPEAAFAEFLASVCETARGLFGGPLSYAAGLWEQVDWSLFDVVGLDAYRDAGNRDAYAERLRTATGFGRPAVVTEFGCATWRGAADAGGMGWTVIERGPDRRVRNGVVRDEGAQAAELTDLLDTIDAAGLDGAFVYTYVAPSYPADPDPRHDLDTASFALLRTWPDGRTEPKAAYRAVAERY